MEGNLDMTDGLHEHAGIIPRILFNLFKDLEAESQDFSVKVSYIELYNEDLKDLLSSNDDARKLRIQDEGTKKGILNGHEEVLIKNAADGIRVLKQGSTKRHAAQTNCNKNSRYYRALTFFTMIRFVFTNLSFYYFFQPFPFSILHHSPYQRNNGRWRRLA